MLSEFGRVGLKDTIFQVTRSKMEYYIQQVDQIHEVVQAKPDEQSFPSDFRKTKAENDDPKVVQKGKGNHHGPVITQPACRVEHKRQVASRSVVRVFVPALKLSLQVLFEYRPLFAKVIGRRGSVGLGNHGGDRFRLRPMMLRLMIGSRWR